MKANLEWKESDGYRQVRVEVGFSRNNNCFVKHSGLVYVFQDFKHGTQVVVKADGKWIPAGRITHGTIFLGPGLSYSELAEKLYSNQKYEPVIMQ